MHGPELAIRFMGRFARHYRDALLEAIPQAHEIEDGYCDAIVASEWHLPEVAGQPRLVQICSAGIDGFDLARLPEMATVCNCSGHEGAIAEYVIGAAYALGCGLIGQRDRLAMNDWSDAPRFGAAPRDGISGSRFGVLGYGRVGRSVAASLRRLGHEVFACNRSRVAGEICFSLDELDSFLTVIDHLVVTLPLSDDTRALLGSRHLAMLGPRGLLINVGRADTIDRQALYDALVSSALGGAALDVWHEYPSTVLAGDEFLRETPFHRLRNVLATPHIAGWSRATFAARQHQMASNLEALLTGAAFLNIVRPPLVRGTHVSCA